ncbi:MAG TPA: trehalose-phosphatase, partial [candidate division Zixibacteria bacterium]|nr:trehalose-phosphatase [candidate division Zixibacteria bacterium]
LDYDGTLAPFHADRMSAHPDPGVIPRLQELSANEASRVAIVSGRPLSELKTLLGPDLPLELWGAHGWEHRSASGDITVRRPPEPVRALMEAALETVRDRVPVGLTERKAGSVAVHVRPLDDADRKTILSLVEEQWRPLTVNGTLELRAFDGGFELRALGCSKATAVGDVLREESDQHTGGLLVAYLGDDDTDEDAFVALRDTDWPVLVQAGARMSHARYLLRPPDELLRFLDRWNGVTG